MLIGTVSLSLLYPSFPKYVLVFLESCQEKANPIHERNIPAKADLGASCPGTLQGGRRNLVLIVASTWVNSYMSDDLLHEEKLSCYLQFNGSFVCFEWSFFVLIAAGYFYIEIDTSKNETVWYSIGNNEPAWYSNGTVN